jgi:NDP-sugar pyrophosphorylase family protein
MVKMIDDHLQAVLFATGETEKLHPLAATIPSPMITIVNRPVMEIAVDQLARQGIKQIFVCLYHLPGSIESYFGDGRRWGVRFEYVLLQDNWGTAGVLRWLKSAITDSFVFMRADTIIDLSVHTALEQHRSDQNTITMVVAKAESGNDNRIYSEKQFRLAQESDRPVAETTFFSETGAYILKPEVIDWIPARSKWDIHTDLVPGLTDAGHKIGTYILAGYWNPMESFQDIQDAQRVLLNREWDSASKPGRKNFQRSRLFPGRMISPGVWVGRNSSIHPGAHISPPVLIGDHSRIGRGVELGPEVVVGDNVIVADDATVRSSTIFGHTYVGRLIHIDRRLVEGSLVVDVESSEHVYVSDHFLFSETPHAFDFYVLYRLFDIVLAGMLLLISFPLILTLILLQIISGRKVFQETVCARSGCNVNQMNGPRPEQSPINLLRFRTRMESGEFTSIGRWLEQAEIHRLPELWNVLVGDLRFVGVKPLSIEDADRLTEAWQQVHHDYAPGFTGLWYLLTTPNSDLDEILVTDIFYLKTRTIKEDLKIILKTPGVWLSRLKKPVFSATRLVEQ